MERYNFQKIEKKWRDDPNATSVKKTEKDKKFYCLECFLTRLKSIWDT